MPIAPFNQTPETMIAGLPANLQSPAADLLKAVSGVSSNTTQVENSIKSIADVAQTMIEKSIMGRGLSYRKFYSAGGASINASNWSKNFPYRLLVLRVDKLGNYSEVAAYRLPINPQEMTIVNRFAIKTTITSRGVLEEHNGLPIKQITINGTTGVLIDRPTGDRETKRNDIIGTIFGGTLDAIGTARSQLQTFTQGVPTFANNQLDQQDTSANADTPNSPIIQRSGYYQYHMLRLFIETYAEVKKSTDARNLRLAFEIPKDKVTYLVSPEPDGFITRRTVQSPMEYLYTLKLLAWGTIENFRRTSTFGEGENGGIGPINRDIGQTQRLFNQLRQLRKTITAFKNVVSAARADIESNIFGPINDAILLTKDVLSIPKTIADFLKTLRDSFQSSVVANWDSLSRSNENLSNGFRAKIQNILNESSGSQSFVGAATDGGATTTFKSDVLDSLDLTDSVEIGSLPITEAQQDAIDAATNKALLMTNNDVLSLVNELQNLTDALEADILLKNALDGEWDILYDTQDTIMELYASIADGGFRVSTTSKEDAEGNAALSVDPIQFWRQSTANANIPFENPLGKFAVPFPFRGSLEALAATYLGDATRWTEIAAINGLQYPYIDEDGFFYSFIGNGSGNQFNVNTESNIFVGQRITISSDTQLPSARKIQAISKITETNFLITVDGTQNLSGFTTQANAKMKAFLPYTINSLRQIFIPSGVPPGQEELDTKPLTFLTDDIELVKFAKIDFLLDSNFDFAVTQDGFFNLAFGSSNLQQAAVIKVKTVKDSLLLHPGWGAGVEPGTSVADINLKEEADSISNAFSSDPRFNTPSKIDLQLISGVLMLNLVAVVRQSDTILPIVLPLTTV